MIYVTQGYERSISTEIFIKSILLLPNNKLQIFRYIIDRKVLEQNLFDLKISYKIKNNILIVGGKNINCIFFETENGNSSLTSLDKSLKIYTKKDVLITLPNSKDKFYKNKNLFNGHTEYFRNFYNSTITMNFITENEQILLLTDHIKLSKVPSCITAESVIDSVKSSIEGHKNYFNNSIKQVIFSGINPHAGENGIIGNEDNVITIAIDSLQKNYPSVQFCGPFSGDTLHLYNSNSNNILKVFAFHDQGLPYFKFKSGFLGANISFGFNFVRLSVDHGTAENLYGKNMANPVGSLYVINKALEIHEKINT